MPFSNHILIEYLNLGYYWIVGLRSRGLIVILTLTLREPMWFIKQTFNPEGIYVRQSFLIVCDAFKVLLSSKNNSFDG